MTQYSPKAVIPLPNGWTLSIATTLPPAVCSVAAWPTERITWEHWYEWRPGTKEEICLDLAELLKAIMTIVNLPAAP